MGDIVSGTEHGKIDLNPIIEPMIDCIKNTPEKFLRESKGKVYVVTDDIIKGILEDKSLTDKLARDGQLFSDTKYADAIATMPKSGIASENQMKGIAELEDMIYNRLCSELRGKEADFFSQNATDCFETFKSLTGKEADISSSQIAPFPDARLLREYPGTKARLRVPHHTIQMSDAVAESLVNAVKRAMRTRLKDELPDEEIDTIIATAERDMNENRSPLSTFLDVLDRDAYGRIRRTYACSVLSKMAGHLPPDSPAVAYSRRVSDFNELVQGTLPECNLSSADLVMYFPNAHGKGLLEFDLMTEFAHADALNTLPFWISFNELLSEVTVEHSVTTTVGQHFKLNGKVQNKGFDSVFEYNIANIETLARGISTALEKGKMPPDENAIRRALRITVLYYVVFRDSGDSKQPRTALANYNELREAVKKLVAEKVGADEILIRIAAKLLKIGTVVNKKIKADFKTLLKSRKLDDLSQNKEKLYLIISREILSKTPDMERAVPIVSEPSPTSYLRYLKVSRHLGDDLRALIKEDIRITESLRYLTSPEPAHQKQGRRGMKRDINRKVLGVLFTPRDSEMIRLSLPFEGLAKLIISYSRSQLHHSDAYLAGIAQLVHVLLVYGVLKAVSRIEDSGKPYNDRTMLLMLSLFSTSPQPEIWAAELLENGEKRGFTHDAHKAVEHLIRQHSPTKSQGFRLRKSAEWDKLIASEQWRNKYPDLKTAAHAHIKSELKDYRFWNIVTGLSSGMDALWQLTEEPAVRKVALISVTSRSCDRLRKRSEGDRSIMFGHIRRFEHETKEEGNGDIRHFYRHLPVQAFCDDMERDNCFKNPSILFTSVRKLYEEGFRDVMIVSKVPFTRRIRMTTEDDSTYTNPVILLALNKTMPDLRVYPLFTQKSFGLRYLGTKTAMPMFIPPDTENDKSIYESSDKSTLFRAASVVTCRVVEGGESSEKLHSGITDYLFRCYPETVSIQSEAMSALITPGKKQACLHEILRFLHCYAYEKSVGKSGSDGSAEAKALEAKLDALDSVIGEDSVGQQADALRFPKLKRGIASGGQSGRFSVNIIALLKHIENQSDLYRSQSEKWAALNHP